MSVTKEQKKPKLEKNSVRIRGRKRMRVRGKKGAPGERASMSKRGHISDIVFS